MLPRHVHAHRVHQDEVFKVFILMHARRANEGIDLIAVEPAHQFAEEQDRIEAILKRSARTFRSTCSGCLSVDSINQKYPKTMT
jgi:hypothetical protein